MHLRLHATAALRSGPCTDPAYNSMSYCPCTLCTQVSCHSVYVKRNGNRNGELRSQYTKHAAYFVLQVFTLACASCGDEAAGKAVRDPIFTAPSMWAYLQEFMQPLTPRVAQVGADGTCSGMPWLAMRAQNPTHAWVAGCVAPGVSLLGPSSTYMHAWWSPLQVLELVVMPAMSVVGDLDTLMASGILEPPVEGFGDANGSMGFSGVTQKQVRNGHDLQSSTEPTSLQHRCICCPPAACQCTSTLWSTSGSHDVFGAVRSAASS